MVMDLIFVIIYDKLTAFEIDTTRILRIQNFPVNFSQELLINSSRCTTSNLDFFSLWRYSPNLGLGLPPWNYPFHFGLLDLRHSVGLLGAMISSSQGLYLYTNTEKRTYTQTPNIHALSGTRTHDPSFRPLGYRDRLKFRLSSVFIL
jgi:hypothetical protein